MKTIKLTDDQFETLFHFVDERVEDIVDRSVQFQDSEILEDWEDLFDVHTVLEEAKEEAECGFDYYNFDWEEVDYETVEIKEEEIPNNN